MKSLFCTAAVLASMAAAPVFAQPSPNVEPRGSLSGVGGASVSGPRADVFEPSAAATPAPNPSSSPVGGDPSGPAKTHPDTTAPGSAPSRSTSATGGASTGSAEGASTSASGSMDARTTRLGTPPSDYPPCRSRGQDRCRVGRR